MREFEWDDEKAETNWRKHGVTFDQAMEVFKDPHSIDKRDRRRDYGEKRWQITGRTEDLCLTLFVVYTKRHGKRTTRIISARRANRRERRQYDNRKA